MTMMMTGILWMESGGGEEDGAASMRIEMFLCSADS